MHAGRVAFQQRTQADLWASWLGTAGGRASVSGLRVQACRHYKRDGLTCPLGSSDAGTEWLAGSTEFSALSPQRHHGCACISDSCGDEDGASANSSHAAPRLFLTRLFSGHACSSRHILALWLCILSLWSALPAANVVADELIVVVPWMVPLDQACLCVTTETLNVHKHNSNATLTPVLPLLCRPLRLQGHFLALLLLFVWFNGLFSSTRLVSLLPDSCRPGWQR